MHVSIWMSVMHDFICKSRGIAAYREVVKLNMAAWLNGILVQATFNEKNIATQRKKVSQVIYTDYNELRIHLNPSLGK